MLSKRASAYASHIVVVSVGQALKEELEKLKAEIAAKKNENRDSEEQLRKKKVRKGGGQRRKGYKV